jgi:enoyl-CoA hydratase/carnithine racemase
MADTYNSPAGQILPVLHSLSPERDGHVLLIGLSRPHKRSSFDRAMLADLSRAYAVLESDTAVRATPASAHLARTQGEAAAIQRLRPTVTELFASADAAEGVQSFVERREAHFQGR